jgi:hypothetical protein
MKKLAALLVLFGSGLAAYGISGFSGSFSPRDTAGRIGVSEGESGEFGWSQDSQIEIVVGVVSLVGGLILRKDI